MEIQHVIKIILISDLIVLGGYGCVSTYMYDKCIAQYDNCAAVLSACEDKQIEKSNHEIEKDESYLEKSGRGSTSPSKYSDQKSGIQ